MLETIVIDYTDPSVTVQQVMDTIETATCRLMLRMWGMELHSVDGWIIQRIETRGYGNTPDIINLRPYNTRTKKYYQERRNA